MSLVLGKTDWKGGTDANHGGTLRNFGDVNPGRMEKKTKNQKKI